MRGIKIEGILQSSRVSLFAMEKSVPLDTWLKCPSCQTDLRLICRLSGSGDDRQIRYGLCEKCGYMGYMDRPSRKWMIDFYSRDWDKAFPKTMTEIQNGTILPGKGVKPSSYLAASLIEKIGPDKEKPVCEIGSGYGQALKYFKDSGFKKVIGIENSKHRAEMVNKALGFDIIHGGFGDEDVHGQLLKYKPIGLFFSHHVLEHVYDPAEVISRISSLQEEGDNLILALPNSEGEHINYALLYLVHLHSFTKESLEILLNRNGYEIVADNSPDNSNMIIAAKKTANPQPKFKTRPDYHSYVLKRIEKGFDLNKIDGGGLYELYWQQNPERDKAEVREIVPGLAQKLSWNMRNTVAYVRSRLLKRFTSVYTMLISGSDDNGDFFEVKFPNKIKFLIK